MDSTPSVRVFTWLDDPDMLAQFIQVSKLSAVVAIKNITKLTELLVVDPLFNVEGQGQNLETVLSYSVIIDFHVVIEGLFVAEVKVVLHVVAGDCLVSSHILVLLVFCIGPFSIASLVHTILYGIQGSSLFFGHYLTRTCALRHRLSSFSFCGGSQKSLC